jgi:tRNA (adenine22-N1)-methyltransferase
MQLSARLAAIAALVPKNSRVADIGTDHGYLPIYLARQEKASYIIATDINQGPLDNAKKHMTAYQIDTINLRKGNGLAPLSLEDHIDTLILSGMGGHLMIDIIKKDLPIVKACQQLILQPQTGLSEIRHFLHESGMCIEKEDFVAEEDKFYPILFVKWGQENYEHEYEYYYGRYQLLHPNTDFLKYLAKRKVQLLTIKEALADVQTQTAIKRREMLQEEFKLYQEAVKCIR